MSPGELESVGERRNKVVCELLDSPPSYTCMDLTLNNISKVLRTEVGARQPICMGYAQVPDWPTAWHTHGTNSITVPWL